MGEDYDAIVIGSGLGGLTAGALFARAGHRVLVLERNDAFGGAATTYHRGSMIIEASLHETTDPRAGGDPKADVFQALDLYDDVEFVPIDDFYEVRCPRIGAPLVVPHGFDAIGDTLSRRFPRDALAIRRFLARIQSIQAAMRMLTDKHGGLWWLVHGPELPLRFWSVLRDMRSSLSAVLERYFADNEALKIALAANLPYYSDNPDQMWWLAYAIAQGGFFCTGGSYLKGGSQTLSDGLVNIIREEGGEALTGRSVIEILLDDGGAVSRVRHRPRPGGDDVTSRAPVVFANASPHAIVAMLPGNKRERFMAPYADMPLSISVFSINLGLGRRPSELGLSSYSTALIPEWMERLSDFQHNAALLSGPPAGRLPAFMVVDYSRIDSGIVDGGMFPLSVVGIDRLSNWSGLDDAAYDARRAAWLHAIIERLDREWPGLGAAVVEKHMATARTMANFLATPEGAIYGFAPNVPDHLPLSGPPRTPETSIPGLWLASSFGGFGGYSGAMGAGAAAAKAALSKFS
jgi:phytoene dehydrogenase-like protein